MRFNIFRNKHVDAQVGYLVDSMVDARRNETEAYWRKTIAEEIYDACPSTNASLGSYPCEDCYEIYEFILNKVKPSHDS